MSKVQFLMFPGHPVKFNSALVLSIEKGEEKGPNIVLNFVDARVSVIRFTTAEERDAAFDECGNEPFDNVQKWAVDLLKNLMPSVERYLSNLEQQLERDLKAQAEHEEWLKNNPGFMHVPGEGDPIDAYPKPAPGKSGRSGSANPKPKAKAKTVGFKRGSKKSTGKTKTGTKKR